MFYNLKTLPHFPHWDATSTARKSFHRDSPTFVSERKCMNKFDERCSCWGLSKSVCSKGALCRAPTAISLKKCFNSCFITDFLSNMILLHLIKTWQVFMFLTITNITEVDISWRKVTQSQFFCSKTFVTQEEDSSMFQGQNWDWLMALMYSMVGTATVMEPWSLLMSLPVPVSNKEVNNKHRKKVKAEKLQ